MLKYLLAAHSASADSMFIPRRECEPITLKTPSSDIDKAILARNVEHGEYEPVRVTLTFPHSSASGAMRSCRSEDYKTRVLEMKSVSAHRGFVQATSCWTVPDLFSIQTSDFSNQQIIIIRDRLPPPLCTTTFPCRCSTSFLNPNILGLLSFRVGFLLF